MQQKGTITITDDDIQVPEPTPAPAPESHPAPPDPTWWDRVNKGLISPDRFLKWATGDQKATVDDLIKQRDQPPSLSERPTQAFIRTFRSGMQADLAKTASSLTSPVTLGTGALSQAAKLPGAIGTVAKSLLTAGGLGFGAAGGMQAIKGAQEGIKTPQGAQDVLGGLSQVAGAAPAAVQAGRVVPEAMAKIAPQLFAKGESAFVAALSPPKTAIPKLRMAYRRRAPDLKGAPIKDLPDLHNVAEVKRVEAANELNRELSRIAPAGTRIIPVDVSSEIKGAITKSMELSSPKEAAAIRAYATRVEVELGRRPINLGEAESLVQELNARSNSFDKLPLDAQRQRLAEGDPILGEKAFKTALQDQIEAKLSNYRDLKQRYGDWKEIQNQTQNAIDQIERQGTKVNMGQRRALESLLSLGGMVLGGKHGGATGSAIWGFSGYVAGRFMADQILTRLSTPEHALGRAINPSPPGRQIPFSGQVTQPIAGQIGAGERKEEQ